ncbi:MAG: GDSL-type esterase/lipase family protein [Calditrichota bacterium]
MRSNRIQPDHFYLPVLSKIVVFILIIIYASPAQNSDPDPGRFKNEIDEFIQWDKKNSYNEGAILFVGSSSIRLWYTALSSPDLYVINRGFGGSHISDVIYYYDDIVKKYKPSIIVFYAGDNDVADGKSPKKVLADYQKFVSKVEQDFPDCLIYFISIKPSPSRWQYWPRMLLANSKIKEFTKQKSNLIYIDVATDMLDETGNPRPDLFSEDNLHLNDTGYLLWNNILSPYLKLE